MLQNLQQRHLRASYLLMKDYERFRKKFGSAPIDNLIGAFEKLKDHQLTKLREFVSERVGSPVVDSSDRYLKKLDRFLNLKPTLAVVNKDWIKNHHEREQYRVVLSRVRKEMLLAGHRREIVNLQTRALVMLTSTQTVNRSTMEKFFHLIKLNVNHQEKLGKQWNWLKENRSLAY